MIIEWSVIVSAFLLGLFSSAHCIGMCGGIMGALSLAVPAQAPRRRLIILCAYNLGRLLSYTLMGVLVGIFAQQISASGGAVGLRWLAGFLLIAMGLYLANWWRGLTHLETAGRYLWAYIQPIGKRLMPVNSPAKGLLLGALWGWLPCGLVYSALAYSMAQGHWVLAGITMLAFGAGTLPSLLLAGLMAQQLNRLLQLRRVRWSVALLIIVFGIWTLWGAGGHEHNHHHHADIPVEHDVTRLHEHHSSQAVSSVPAEDVAEAVETDTHQHHHH